MTDKVPVIDLSPIKAIVKRPAASPSSDFTANLHLREYKNTHTKKKKTKYFRLVVL